MKIAINALLYSVGQDYRQTGVSRYIDRLLAHLALELADSVVTALITQHVEPGWPGVDLLRAPISAGNPRARIQWEHLRLPGSVRSGGFDLYHGTVNTLPLLPVKAKRVVTIHDLAFLRFPEQITRKRYLYLKTMIGYSARAADAILVPSQATAEDVQNLLKRPSGQVHVTHLGVDPHFMPAMSEAIAQTRTQFGLDRPYILSVGTIEPRKNLQRLVEGFGRLKDDIEHDLVLVGPRGWLTDEIERAISDAQLGDRIKRPGFVGDAGLVGLYSGADAVVVPALYEGFGLPVLEAMACGAVVVTSNVSSLPEVAGNAAVLVDPLDVENIADGIRRALTDSSLRQQLRSAAIERAAEFTWQRTASRTAAVYRSVAA
jgi:glycosyltransferase involved in cell wall biosynthesis